MNKAYAKTRAIQLKEKLDDQCYLVPSYVRSKLLNDIEKRLVLMRIKGMTNPKKAHIFFVSKDENFKITLCMRKDFDTSKAVPAWKSDPICKECARRFKERRFNFLQPLPKISGVSK